MKTETEPKCPNCGKPMTVYSVHDPGMVLVYCPWDECGSVAAKQGAIGDTLDLAVRRLDFKLDLERAAHKSTQEQDARRSTATV